MSSILSTRSDHRSSSRSFHEQRCKKLENVAKLTVSCWSKNGILTDGKIDLMEEIAMSYPDQVAPEDALDQYPSSALMTPEHMLLPYDYQSFISSGELFHHICLAGGELVSSPPSSQLFDLEADSSVAAIATDCPADDNCQAHPIQENKDVEELVIKSEILHHPLFPRMLRAYANCQKSASGGGPSETSFSDETELWDEKFSTLILGSSDPELDEFMETYCEMLEKHNEDLSNTFGGVATFLNEMEMQLADLCGALSETSLSDQPAATGNAADHHASKCNNKAKSDLKMSLLSKYRGGHLNNLKLEFSKRTKKKKGKLPGQARQALLHWWKSHHNWPYPSEADKVELERATGLHPKQINNWFINQRKRHWKTPPESLQYSCVE